MENRLELRPTKGIKTNSLVKIGNAVSDILYNHVY